MPTDQLFANRYRIESRLGVGGMSTVELAFDTRLERHVAVKLLAEHLAQDGSFVSRFRREALAAARLVHPNVVQVFDFGSDEQSGRQFIVMEHVDGESCSQILRKNGRMSPDAAVELLSQACRGLEYAHKHGVVHRDVKPGNLLRNRDGVLKLADFGIAKAAEQSDITKLGSVLGTAAYLSPEQARGEPAGTASDLYALGVVSYQLLAGRLPYEAPSLTELARQQDAGAPLALHKLDRNIPYGVSVAVMRALSSQPEDRQDSAGKLERALRDGLRGVADTAPTAARTSSENATTRFLQRDRTGTATAVKPKRASATTQHRPLKPLQPSSRATHRPLEPLSEFDAPRKRSSVQPSVTAARPRRKRRPWRTFKRFVALVILLAMALGGFLFYQSVTGANERAVQLRENIEGQIDHAIKELERIVRDNTR